MSQNLTHQVILWDEFKGDFNSVSITEIRRDKYGPSARLGAPFDGDRPGWFNLNDLLTKGGVSTSGYTILLNEQWQQDETRLREKHRNLKTVSFEEP